MSQFAFLQREWPAVLEAATRAEEAVHADPRTACFYARRALELAMARAYKHDVALKLSYQDGDPCRSIRNPKRRKSCLRKRCQSFRTRWPASRPSSSLRAKKQSASIY